MIPYRTPGVYKVDVFPPPAVELRTGIPAFLGYARLRHQAGLSRQEAMPLTHWTQFDEQFESLPHSYLGKSIFGFFQNGGAICYVVPLDNPTSPVIAMQKGLEILAPLNTIDLVCAPDIMQLDENGRLNPPEVYIMQNSLLDHCAGLGDRFAILDSLPGSSQSQVQEQRKELSGANSALYYPWIKVQSSASAAGEYIPPCGHIVGVFSRSDRHTGVHKAPANEVLEGVIDLETNLTDSEQGELNPNNINCLRAFPGRGIRVWGARTLSDEPTWMYINVRRLFLMVRRWVEQNLAGMVFEPNDSWLWNRIERELTAYFSTLYQSGALKGGTPQEAFYIKCDSETNPLEVRESGVVVTEIGLAPIIPSEFIVVRIIHGTSGVTIFELNKP
jgi:uncharacterized protein